MTSPADEVVERGKLIYETQIRPHISGSDHGKFIAIDVATGAYDVDVDEMVALRKAKARGNDVRLFVMRIGFDTAHRMGGHLIVPASSI